MAHVVVSNEPYPVYQSGPMQDLLDDGGNTGTDASGNPILKDIGLYLKSEFKKYAPLKVRARVGTSRYDPQPV